MVPEKGEVKIQSHSLFLIHRDSCLCVAHRDSCLCVSQTENVIGFSLHPFFAPNHPPSNHFKKFKLQNMQGPWGALTAPQAPWGWAPGGPWGPPLGVGPGALRGARRAVYTGSLRWGAPPEQSWELSLLALPPAQLGCMGFEWLHGFRMHRFECTVSNGQVLAMLSMLIMLRRRYSPQHSSPG